MYYHTVFFSDFLHTVLSKFLGQESEYTHIQDIPLLESDWLSSLIDGQEMSFEEQIILLLALIKRIP
jgi:hypothetical protein